jgi:predicted 3-demethylubiquinone-9 3-methyltransferase (glyoxalase superfamily)
MQKITPFLWFDDNAEAAINFYVSLFDDAAITSVSHYPDEVPGRGGQVMSASFQLEGQEFMALNGGPQFKFNEAVSFFVRCHTQDEVDRLWSALTADGGEEGECGWLKDKFGLSWQIIPTLLNDLLSDPDPARAGRAMNAMLQMKKIDMAALQRAADGV